MHYTTCMSGDKLCGSSSAWYDLGPTSVPLDFFLACIVKERQPPPGDLPRFYNHDGNRLNTLLKHAELAYVHCTVTGLGMLPATRYRQTCQLEQDWLVMSNCSAAIGRLASNWLQSPRGPQSRSQQHEAQKIHRRYKLNRLVKTTCELLTWQQIIMIKGPGPAISHCD